MTKAIDISSLTFFLLVFLFFVFHMQHHHLEVQLEPTGFLLPDLHKKCKLAGRIIRKAAFDVC